MAKLDNNYWGNVRVKIIKLGGDDAINGYVPLEQYKDYQSARPDIHIPKNLLADLDGSGRIGLHPELLPYYDIFQAGDMALFPVVGSPNGTRSHFKERKNKIAGKTESAPLDQLDSGMEARLMAAYYPNYPKGYPNDKAKILPIISLKNAPSIIMKSNIGPAGLIIKGGPPAYHRLVRDTTQQGAVTDSQGGYYENVRMVEAINSKINDYAKMLADAYNSVDSSTLYLSGSVAQQLLIASRLIRSGLEIKMIVIVAEGYDTHDSQGNHEGFHANLYTDISGGLSVFRTELMESGDWERTTVSIGSEFGREWGQNAGRGTDHGTTGAMIVMGGRVKGGIYGNYPDFAPENLTENALNRHNQDWRDIEYTISRHVHGIGAIGSKIMELENRMDLGFMKSDIEEASRDQDFRGQILQIPINTLPDPGTDPLPDPDPEPDPDPSPAPDIVKRLEDAESRLAELENQNKRLKKAFE